MALLNPKQIYEVLKSETPPPAPRSGSRANSNLSLLLEKNNLTVDEVLDNLSSQMRSAESDAVRFQATKTALQLNGVLNQSDEKQNMNVTINIIDSEFSQLNPILIPR